MNKHMQTHTYRCISDCPGFPLIHYISPEVLHHSPSLWRNCPLAVPLKGAQTKQALPKNDSQITTLTPVSKDQVTKMKKERQRARGYVGEPQKQTNDCRILYPEPQGKANNRHCPATALPKHHRGKPWTPLEAALAL